MCNMFMSRAHIHHIGRINGNESKKKWHAQKLRPDIS